MSKSFKSHIQFPRLTSAVKPNSRIKPPSAISALAWREHIQAVENEKIAKANAVQERKLERQKRKLEKLEKIRKNKRGKKREKRSSFNEELDSDVED